MGGAAICAKEGNLWSSGDGALGAGNRAFHRSPFVTAHQQAYLHMERILTHDLSC